MKILNLGCGTKVSDCPGVVNIDWSIELRLSRNKLTKKLVPLVVRGDRLDRFRSLPENIQVYNLARGIPFSDESVDVVYHSHLLEHLDRDVVEHFLLEVRRVLKPGGIQRIVVPNLELICSAYLEHVTLCRSCLEKRSEHDKYIADILEQCVRREAYGTSCQKGLSRILENLFLGDARQRGETHQWMYDEFNLGELLGSLGYSDLTVQTFKESLIPSWSKLGLDQDRFGEEYKPRSLYIEVLK